MILVVSQTIAAFQAIAFYNDDDGQVPEGAMVLSLIGLILKVLNLITNYDSVRLFCCGRLGDETAKRANMYGKSTHGNELGLSFSQRVSQA